MDLRDIEQLRYQEAIANCPRYADVKAVVDAVKIPVVVNGGVTTAAQAAALGAGGVGQTLDIGFSIAQALEKGRDRHNRAAVCQADSQTGGRTSQAGIQPA